MIPRPQTIQIILPGGDPRGIRVASNSTRIAQVIEVPRSLLKDFLRMDESDQAALYFLVSEAEDVGDSTVYIGQADNLRMCLANNHQNEDAWERALVVVSGDRMVTRSHARFLESYCIQELRAAGRYRGTSLSTVRPPRILGRVELEALEIFDTVRALLATLGHPLFDSVARPHSRVPGEGVFYCHGLRIDGRGLYTPEGFVVLRGSNGPRDVAPAFANSSYGQLRSRLISSGAVEVHDQKIVFMKDQLFRDPTTAAAVVMGSLVDGWDEWMSREDQTLGALHRQSLADMNELTSMFRTGFR